MNDKLDQTENALLAVIDEKIASVSFMDRVQLLYQRVECLMSSGKYREAVGELTTLQLLDPCSSAKILTMLRECYIQIEDMSQLAAVEQQLAKTPSFLSDKTCHVSVSFNHDSVSDSALLPRMHPAIEAAMMHPIHHTEERDDVAAAATVRLKQFEQLKKLILQHSSDDWSVVTPQWWREFTAYLSHGNAEYDVCSVLTHSGVSSVLRDQLDDVDAVYGLALTQRHIEMWREPTDMRKIGEVSIDDARLSFVLLPVEAWRALCVWCSSSEKETDEDTHVAKTDSGVTDVVTVSAEVQDMLNDWITLEDVILLLHTRRQRSNSVMSTVTPCLLCAVCKQKSELRCSKCHTVVYCSAVCQAIHWKYHKTMCSAGASADSSARGVAGLANLGNSCYLNSSLQCLSHIFPLTRYFISGKYERDVNVESRDGAQGELAKEYATLLRDMWLKSRASGAVVVFPTALKRVLGRLNSDYASLQQQDAHDVLEMLLDRLHEDVNLISKKPYCEKAEGDGSNDLQISREAWQKHSLRNRSLVGDIVGGMLRSYLRCPSPSCNRISVTFDYHNTLQLAIPNMSTLSISVVWLPVAASAPVTGSATSLQPHRVVLEIDRLSSVALLKREVCRKLLSENCWTSVEGVSLNDITMLLLERTSASGFTASRLLNDDDGLSSIAGIETSEVGMYWSPPNARMQGSALMLQSIVSAQERQGKSNLVGYPLLIPFDYDWSVMRFRCELWQHVSRAVIRDRLGGYAPSGNMAVDLRMGQRLALRHCDRVGEAAALKRPAKTTAVSQAAGNANVAPSAATAGLHGKVPPEEAEWMHRAGLSATAQCADAISEEEYYRGLLPTNKDITMKDVLGHADPNSIPFFCVTWTKAWQPFISMKEVTRVNGAALRADGNAARRDQLTLHRCLQHFTSEEILDEENAWYCSNCKEHRQAHKKLSFWHLPDVLIIGLKRFEYRSRASMHELGRPRFSSYREKIDTYVDFPIDGLDMSPYCDPHSDSLGGSTIYDLFGVCNHYGRMGFGHYVAMARGWDVHTNEGDELGDEWYCYDDENVQPIDEKAVKSNAAYILFYKRRK